MMYWYIPCTSTTLIHLWTSDVFHWCAYSEILEVIPSSCIQWPSESKPWYTYYRSIIIRYWFFCLRVYLTFSINLVLFWFYVLGWHFSQQLIHSFSNTCDNCRSMFNIYWTVIFVAYDCIPYCILQLAGPNSKVRTARAMLVYILVFTFVMNLVQIYTPNDQLSQELTQGFRGPYTLHNWSCVGKVWRWIGSASTMNITFGKISSGLVDINSSQIASTSVLTSQVRHLSWGGRLDCSCWSVLFVCFMLSNSASLEAW